MRSFLSVLLGCILLSSPLHVKAQAFSMACPIPTPGAFWANTDVTTLAISSFSGNIQIDGTFTVNADFTLDGAEVAINTGGSIIVLPGFTLRIINNSILTNIQAVWEGIEVRPGGFLEIEDSDVCGAVTAIEADNGFSATAGSIEIINSGLRFNHTGIELTRYNAAPYPAFIVGTHFEGGVLPFGAPTANSFQGISGFRIDGGTGLTVGAVNTTWAANLFTDMEFGIDVRSSSLQAFNNTFERIQPDALSTSGIAIRAQPNPSGPYVVAVGTAADRANTMTDCRIGVSTVGMGEVNVSDNTMTATTAPFERGVEIEQTRDIVIVAENTIRDFTDIGVFLNEHPGSPSLFTDASINNNTIVGSFGTSQGVFVDEFVGGIRVRANIPIDQVYRGVTIQNATPDGPMAGVRVDENNITFGYPGAATTTDPAVGVLMVEADEPWVDNNTITGNCDFPGGGVCTTATANNSRIRGIQTQSTTDALIFKNTISNCGGGLVVNKRNPGGNVLCNLFDDCLNGVVWSNVNPVGSPIIDDFGVLDAGQYKVFGLTAPDASSENQWTSPVMGFEPVRSFAANTSNASLIDWYFRPAATYNFPPLTNLDDGSGIILSVVPGIATPICSMLPLTGGGGTESSTASGPETDWNYIETSRQVRLAQFIGQSIDQMLVRDYAYLRSALEHGTTNPLALDVIDMTDIPVLHNLERNWHHQSDATFATTVSSLTPETDQERAYQSLWSMRLAARLDSNHVDWNNAEMDRLWAIATADYDVLGEAKFMAQSMLNVALVEDDWRVEEESARMANTEQSIASNVWPNPASELVFVKSVQTATNIRVVDAMGKTVISETMDGSSTLSIDCSGWPSGVYWVIQSTETGRLYIDLIQTQRR